MKEKIKLPLDKTLLKNEELKNKKSAEKGELIINVCANKKDLLKLKSILIEFKNENLFEKEITNDEPKRIVRR